MRQRERAGNGTDQHRDATHGGCSDDHLLHAEVGGAKVVIRNLTQRNVNRHGSEEQVDSDRDEAKGVDWTAEIREDV